jgi:predicted nucleotidyltransferase component of viral defense system
MPTKKYHIESLPGNTASVLTALSQYDLFEDFTLIGGTAIALHAGHRISEDIDLACINRGLPRKKLRNIIEAISRDGHTVVMGTDEGARLYWENEGADIDDYQQDWIIDGVKVTFVSPDTDERGNFLRSNRDGSVGHIPLMSMDGLFELKSRVLVKRTASRDGFDLWYFMAIEKREIADVFALAKKESHLYSDDMIYNRLCPGKYLKTDPGFETKRPEFPQSKEDLRSALLSFIDQYQQAITPALLADAHDKDISIKKTEVRTFKPDQER